MVWGMREKTRTAASRIKRRTDYMHGCQHEQHWALAIRKGGPRGGLWTPGRFTSLLATCRATPEAWGEEDAGTLYQPLV
jgi:hypothetical protein